MKKTGGFSVAGVIAGVVIVAVIAVGAFFVIDGNNKATNFNEYDFYSIIQPDANNGNIGDHVKGDPEAPVVIFEYADYQCPGCASMNKRVNSIIEELDGKLAVVYRSYLLSYHQNGTAAASAAEAAGLQGYWKQYADKLFTEQAEWEYASPSERTELFDKYFVEVTGGKGDLERFHKDIASEAVSKKISFDMGIGRRIDIAGTPAFYVDGQLISWNAAGEVIIDGKTVSWEEPQEGTHNFANVIKKIVEAKTGK